MKTFLRLIPLLAILGLVTALAIRRSKPIAWSATPLEVSEITVLPALVGDAALESGAVEEKLRELNGIVRGPDGGPLAEAVVLLDAPEPRWAYTDSGGRFRIDRVPLGPQTLSVWAREHGTRSFPVDALAGELNLQLDESLVELPVLPDLETQDFSGEVVPAISGRGLAGHEVLLLPAKPISHFGEPVPRRVTVGADRSFHVEDLILGEYRVVVLPPWARGGGWPNLCAPRSRGLEHTLANSTSVARIELATGEIHGTVTDLKGHFLGGAICMLSVDALPDRIWPAVTTAEDGSFLLRDLPPEVYRLQIRAGSGLLSLPIEVPPGTTVEADLPPIDPSAQ